MSTTVRTVRGSQSLASTHDSALAGLGGAFTPPDILEVNEIEVLSDEALCGGIGAAWLEIAGSDQVVLSICGRDRRLRLL